MVGASVAILAIGLAIAQPPFGPFGGGRGPSDPASLLNNPSVKKELKLTDEQLAQVPQAVMKALEQVLDKDQLKRLKQIHLQQRGPTQAFKDPQVQTALKFSNEQKESINTILDESAAQTKELAGRDFTKALSLRKETNEKLQNVLTAEQRRIWRDMVGDEFKMEFGGTRPGFDFKKKKKD
jgi:hypothetical protein